MSENKNHTCNSFKSPNNNDSGKDNAFPKSTVSFENIKLSSIKNRIDSHFYFEEKVLDKIVDILFNRLN